MFGDHDHFTLVANLNSFFFILTSIFPLFFLSNYKQSDHYSFPVSLFHSSSNKWPTYEWQVAEVWSPCLCYRGQQATR